MFNRSMMRWTKASRIRDLGLLDVEQHIKASCISKFANTLAKGQLDPRKNYQETNIVSKCRSIRHYRSNSIIIH